MAKLDKLLGKAQEHLDADEEVVASIQGTYETKIAGNDSVRTGIFAATDKRLVFYAKKMMGYDLESFPYDHISSFEMSKGAMGHKMSFFASGNKVAMKWINKGDIPGFTEAVRSRMGKPAGAPAAPHEEDVTEQLRKLASLRDEGILTEDEFQAKKQELLAKL